jgi:peptidoglycan hydrolase CwlO-like protein
MMNTPIGSVNVDHITGTTKAQSKVKKKSTYRVFFTIWVILILSGIAAAFFYTQLLKNQIVNDISRQTDQQLKQIQANYQEQLTLLQTDVQAKISQLEAKVNTLSELLAFTSDSSTPQTDNSNQLYTQLTELRAQLDELKASLEVLK